MLELIIASRPFAGHVHMNRRRTNQPSMLDEMMDSTEIILKVDEVMSSIISFLP